MEEQNTIRTHVIEYGVTDAAIAELRAKYEILPDASTTQGYKDIRTGIAELRETWVGVEKHRKYLKKDALEYGRKVDAEAKRITAELTSIAEPLKDAKAAEDARKEKIKEEKKRLEQERIAAIEAKAESIRDIYRESMGKDSQYISGKLMALKSMEITESEFAEMTERAEALRGKIVDMMTLLLEQTMEQERIAREQQEREAELKRMEEEAEKRRIEMEAQERKERAAREAKELAERQERERLRKIEDDKLAKIRAEEAEKLRIEREKLESERRELEEKRIAEKKRIAAEALEKKRKEVEEAERKKKEEEAKAAKERYDTSVKETTDAIIEICGSDAGHIVVKKILSGDVPHVTFNP